MPRRLRRPLRPAARRERREAFTLAGITAVLGLSILAFALYCGFVAGYQGTGDAETFALIVALLSGVGLLSGVILPACLIHHGATVR